MLIKNEARAVGALSLLYAFRMLGLFMVLPILVLYGNQYAGATPTMLGLALGVYGLTQALFQIPLGMLSDFVSRKLVISAGLLIFALGSVIAAMAESIVWLIIGRALQGSGAIASTIMALVSDITCDENRTKAMASIGASIGTAFSLAMILGPFLGGVGGLSLVFYVCAGLAIAGVAIVVWVVPTPNMVTQNRESAPVLRLLKTALRNIELMRLNVGVFVLHALLMLSFLAWPVIMEQDLGLNRSYHWAVYLLLVACAMAVIIPLIIFSERKQKIKPVFISGVATLVISMLVFALLPVGHWGFWFCMVVFFTAFNLLEATLPSLVSKLSPVGSRGTAMGVYASSQFFGAFIGGFGGGILLNYFGVSGVFWGGVVLSLAWLWVAMFMSRPQHLTSLSVSYYARNPSSCRLSDDAHGDILAVQGVHDVLWDSSSKLLYLKVDKAHFNREKLDACLNTLH